MSYLYFILWWKKRACVVSNVARVETIPAKCLGVGWRILWRGRENHIQTIQTYFRPISTQTHKQNKKNRQSQEKWEKREANEG